MRAVGAKLAIFSEAATTGAGGAVTFKKGGVGKAGGGATVLSAPGNVATTNPVPDSEAAAPDKVIVLRIVDAASVWISVTT